jgi:type IV pilus assembly protein PilV
MMPRPTPRRRLPANWLPPRLQRGIALLEAMIAIVILGIGLLGTIGLQARAYSALSDAGLRAEATLAADKLLGTISADSGNVASYALAAGGTPSTAMQPWVTETKAAIPGAIITVVVTPAVRSNQVDITIRWTRKAGTAENRHLVTAYFGS